MTGKVISVLYARAVLVVILAALAWGQYHTNEQLDAFHDQASKQRIAAYRLILANRQTLLRLQVQVAHLDQLMLRKGKP